MFLLYYLYYLVCSWKENTLNTLSNLEKIASMYENCSTAAFISSLASSNIWPNVIHSFNMKTISSNFSGWSYITNYSEHGRLSISFRCLWVFATINTAARTMLPNLSFDNFKALNYSWQGKLFNFSNKNMIREKLVLTKFFVFLE